MKRTIGWILALLLSISILTSYASAVNYKYEDVPDDHWAYSYIRDISLLGIIKGYPDGSFQPNKAVTRGEFLKMITIVMFPDYQDKTVQPGEHWAEQYGRTMVGVMYDEVPYTYADYNEIISRGEMAKFCATVNSRSRMIADRIFDKEGKYVQKMTDWEEISRDYISAVNYCIQAEIMCGFEDGSFRANETLTRAQAAKVIYLTKYNLTTGQEG